MPAVALTVRLKLDRCRQSSWAFVVRRPVTELTKNQLRSSLPFSSEADEMWYVTGLAEDDVARSAATKLPTGASSLTLATYDGDSKTGGLTST